MQVNRSIGTLLPFILSTLLIACNTNTHQLPPVDAPPASVTKACIIDNRNIADVTLYSFKKNDYDSVYFTLKNLADDTLRDIQLLIQISSSDIVNYDNIILQRNVVIPLLLPDSQSSPQSIYTGKQINLDGSGISVGLISYNNRQTAYSRDYPNGYITVLKPDSTTLPGKANAHILADGSLNCFIRYDEGDTFYYHLTGKLDNETLYFGQLSYSNDVPPVNVVLDSLDAANKKLLINDEHNLTLKLKNYNNANISDSIQYITIDLKKN